MPFMLVSLLACSAFFRAGQTTSSMIAYMRDGEVRLINADGKNDRLLVKSDYDRPTWWYPDGSKLIYRHDSPDEGWNMFSVDIQSKEVKALTKGRTHDNRSASFSSDSKRIAYISGKSGLCLMDSEGRQITILNAKAERDVSPSWSADSKNLYYESADSPHGLHTFDLTTRKSSFVAYGYLHQLSTDRKSVFMIRSSSSGSELWERSLASSKEQIWLDRAWNPWVYALSPTGKAIAFYGPKTRSGLYICKAPQAEPKKLAEANPDCVQSLQFSPDGKFIAYTTGERNREDIWIASIDGKISKRLVRGSWPTWQPVSYSLSKKQLTLQQSR